MSQQRVFTKDELKTCDGKEGRPAYVAYKGKVYDVTASKLWKAGMHMRRHSAGVDLSSEIAAAPHKEEVFDRVPQVGVLEPEPAETPSTNLPRGISALLERYPFFQRHPHPMTVHFPIVFMYATPIFAALYLITGNSAFEATSVDTLAAGVLFTPVAMVTGFFTWWVNYMARPVRAVVIKIFASIAMFVLSLVAFVWRLRDPALLTSPLGPHAVYTALLFSLLVLASVLGGYGATLTFPLPRREKSKAAK